jgi:MtN3 and saliva related transmembrane protein
MWTAVIGTVAATLTVIGFVPQAWRIVKTRNTKDLATAMWVCSTSAFALWTLYGVFLRKLPIIVPNLICFFLAGFILMMKVLPRRKRDAVADAVVHTLAPGHEPEPEPTPPPTPRAPTRLVTQG